MFALYNGTMNILPLRCVTAENVMDEISDSLTKYMRQAVVISPHSHQVCLSLFIDYIDYIEFYIVVHVT